MQIYIHSFALFLMNSSTVHSFSAASQAPCLVLHGTGISGEKKLKLKHSHHVKS